MTGKFHNTSGSFTLSLLLFRTALILLLALIAVAGKAQINVSYHGLNEDVLKDLKAKGEVRDSITALREIRRIEQDLIANGFLTAAIDTIVFQEKTVAAEFFKGERYHWAKILKGNTDDEALIKSGYRSKILDRKPVLPLEVAQLHESLVRYYENRGYPFASSQLKNFRYADSASLEATLSISKGPLVKIDSVIIRGDSKLSKTYLTNYIGIKEGDLYDQSLLDALDNRLKELSFVQVFKPSQVGFTKKHTKLFIFINKRNASRFNGILGVLPDNQTGEILITGDAKIALKNAFNRGEFLSLNWRKLQSLTQDLDVQVNYPFILQTPIGVDARLKVFRKDTTYLELNQSLGLQYLFSGGNYLMVFFNNYSSSLLNTDQFVNTTVLPDFADVRFRQYGISINQNKLDYRINPRKGYEMWLSGSAGTKIISKNPDLDEAIYDGVSLNSPQFKLEAKLGKYFPVANRSTVYMKFNGGYIVNDNVFINELFRLGGLHTLRGFDVEVINASLFGIATLEYRFLLEQNSNLYVFGDYAYYERNLNSAHVSDRPFGFGAGISFQTKPGIFSINYALGSEKGNPIQFRAAKVHFGFLNYF